ncbi:betaine lipid synthase [Entomortierella parvispora]|uniref:Betaine lipid synthase n=1 Tax=Entomortierella parvispora TaxID=205924 RepID=A0A9P3M1X3_9FUNG|nr:betaine lipid synthase [Entomortierella parvispora]
MHKPAASGSTVALMVASTSVALYLLNTTGNFKKAQEMMVTSQLAFLGAVAAFVMLLIASLDQVKAPLKFIYSCFLKPLGKTGDVSNQKGRLEAFYKDQAEIYDETRGGLLRGRSTMLALVAAQLKDQLKKSGSSKAPIWVDLGGGTGWNIEQMNNHFPISKFERVYLVDLCPSLCKVARERFQKFGWTNVVVLCEDALGMDFPGMANPVGQMDVVTMSYSLSMMDNYYAVIDHVQKLLKPKTGFLGVSDFYASTSVQKASAHGVEDYHCNWFTRNFWQIWFAFDHVHLHASRREYLEYRFDVKKAINGRNHFVIPFVVQIPYYAWIGQMKKDTRASEVDTLSRSRSMAGSSISLDPIAPMDEPAPLQLQTSDLRPRSMSTDSNASQDSVPDSPSSVGSSSTLVGTSISPQKVPHQKVDSRFGVKQSQWRLSYDPTLECHTQFRSYIYAFTWEDPRIDLEVLDLKKDDVMFVITSAGDNALEYALQGQPARIHCVDMNPCQNHLLELKLACINNLPHSEFWQMFGEGRHSDFRRLLIDQLSPSLSSTALQFWYKNRDTFDQSFYETGYSGLALRLFKWLVKIKGLKKVVQEITTTDQISTQEHLWENVVKPSTLPVWLVQWVLSHPAFLWNALGVPINQMKLILDEGNAVQYIYDTLDPIMNRSLFKDDQYFYNLVVNRKYTPESCPSYLTEAGFTSLRENKSTDSMMLHTKSIIQVLRSMKDGELTKAVLMDHMDWFDPKDADEEIREVARAVRTGGMVLWRSAGRQPWYNALFEKYGFKVEAVGVRVPGSGVSIDRVNMYASCYRAIKK